jgi:formate C-acetyltransferase
MGMINVADGICAINKLVFEQGKYTIDQINEAVRTDFKGSAHILEDMLKCPKFGRDREAEDYAVRVADIMQRVIRSHDHDNFYYSPSLHTLDSNVKYGARWGAGYDGRRAGAPFAKNGGPTNLARGSDPTSVVLAAAKLPQYQFYGGQPIDVHFQIDTVKNHKGKIAALIKTYLDNGGLQFQVNALSAATLRDAVANPEAYEHLVVRIGGYSCYFNSLTKASKEEFIHRFEIEEG